LIERKAREDSSTPNLSENGRKVEAIDGADGANMRLGIII
jgi:hypothetical protein